VQDKGKSELAELATLSSQLAEEYGAELSPGFDLRAIAVLQETLMLGRAVLDAAVRDCRADGATWQEIADAASCSKQNAFTRWHWVDQDL
jgi:hypothetical protein